MNHLYKYLIISNLLIILTSCLKEDNIDNPEPPKPTSKMDWWDEAKFGMFIHFGVYSVPAGEFAGTDLDGVAYPADSPKLSGSVGAEWIMYTAKIPRETYKLYAKDFTCHNFNANQIADLAKSCGMNYLVITLKHHDGFVMYPTKLTDWNISNSGAKGLDIIEEMQKACVSRGIKFGVYFSQNIDWMTDESYGYVPEIKGRYEKHEKYNNYTVNLIHEFVTRYPSVDLIWWDGYLENTNAHSANCFLQTAENIRPDIIFNDRLYSKHEGDYITPEMSLDLSVQKFKRFELCKSINEKSWGYSQSKWQNSYMTKEEIIINLLRCIQYGGNFLLNIGPKSDGSIPLQQSEPLEKAGYIIQSMGGIQGTKSLNQLYGQHNCFCRYTVKDGNTKLHITKMPNVTNPEIMVTGIRNSIISVESNHTARKEGDDIIISGFNGEFDTACLLLSGEFDSYDAGINIPCNEIISSLSAFANGEFGIETGDDNQFMLTNWKGELSNSIEYCVNSKENRSYNISIYTAEMSDYEISVDIDGEKYDRTIKRGYQRHKSKIMENYNLNQGTHCIKLTIKPSEGKWANFYGIEFE